jgi:hypothetical protein
MEQYLVRDLDVIFYDVKGRKTKTKEQYSQMIKTIDEYHSNGTKIVRWNGYEYVESEEFFWREKSRKYRVRVVTVSVSKKNGEKIIVVEAW